MELILFGYDADPAYVQRGIARADWSLKAIEDRHGRGWQICTRYGVRPNFMTKTQAIAVLEDR